MVSDIESKLGKPSEEIPLPAESEVSNNELLSEIAKGEDKVMTKWKNKEVNVTVAMTGSKGKIKVLEVYEYKTLNKETKDILKK